jgi:hypothetical protein
MSYQMTQRQLEALQTTLANYGLEVRPIKEPKAPKEKSPLSPKALKELNARIKRIQGMTFATGSVKTRLLKTLRDVKKYGYFSNDAYVRENGY